MDNQLNKDDNYKLVIKFIDAVSKTLEGLKDKYMSQIIESESKKERVEPILTLWVNQTSKTLKEKYEEVFNAKYEEASLKLLFFNWITLYKDNIDFSLNTKVLFKHLHMIRSIIKQKVSANDTLSYVDLTDGLLKKYSTSK